MKGCRWTVRLLLVLLLALLFLLLRLMRRSRPAPGENVVARQERVAREECVKVPAPVYRRPDPLIYSQRYLMSQGLAVTWDNPDIQLFQAGVPVPSHTLAPATEYEIVARIWNGSTDAPAVNLPVRFSYLTFGIGTPARSSARPVSTCRCVARRATRPLPACRGGLPPRPATTASRLT